MQTPEVRAKISETLKRRWAQGGWATRRPRKVFAHKVDCKCPVHGGRKSARTLDDIIAGRGVWPGGQVVRRLLVACGLRKDECEICGQGPEWNGERLVLELDHVNGINTDNRYENWRIVCPNCHSQTSTWKSRNIVVKKACA